MKYYIYILCILVALPAAWSCSADMDGDEVPPPDGQFYLTLDMTLPEPGAGADTRALTPAQEQKVDELRVFMFDTSGNYVHDALGDNVAQSGDQVTCRILMYPGTFHFVVLANSSSFISSSFPGGIPDNITYEKFSEQLIAECPTIWNAGPSPDFIPMWGIAKNQAISLAAPNVSGIRLLRSLARINVEVENTVPGTYVLQSVAVYRNYRRGRVIPEEGKWNGLSVTGTSLPTGGALLNTAGASVTGTGLTSSSCTNEIYVFETPAGADLSSGGADDNFCLILGMLYEGSTSYYRIDFTGTSGYIPILRNHTYLVTVKDIDRPGALTAADALAGRPANITYEITDTNKSGMNHIAWDGQHYLMAASDSLYFWNSPSDITLRVQTNYPGGWKVENTIPWMTAAPLSSPNTTEGTTLLTVTADPTLTVEREGVFTIRAGELSLDIVVTQYHLTELRIDTDIDYMIFYASGNAPVTVNVDRAPATKSYTVEYIGDIVWATPPSSPQTGTQLTFSPADNTTSDILTGIIRLTIVADDGRMATKDITVRQYTGVNPFTVTPDTYYPAIAHQGKFWILSTAPWYLKRSVPVSAATLAGRPLPVASTPQEYEFSLTANDTYEDREVTLVFSTDDDTTEYELTITQDGNVPTLTFNSTLSDQIDVEINHNGPTYADVVFEYNFAWQMVGAADLGNIVQSMSRSTGVTYPCTSIAAGMSETLRITPYDYTGQTNVPQAGTVLTSSIDIFNYATNPYPTTKKGTINLKRTIQPVINMVGVNVSTGAGNIPRGGATITVTAGANAPWQISTSDGQTVSQPTGSYAVNTLSITIPPNNAINQEKQIQLTYTFNGQTVTIGSYTQESYEVSFKDNQPAGTFVFGYGQNYSVTMSGDYPALQLKFFDRDDGTDISDVYNTPAGTTDLDLDLDVPVNNKGNNRWIRLAYSQDGGATWIQSNVNRIQLRDGFYIGNFLISKDNAGLDGNSGATVMNWAQAMGIDTYYNSWTFYNRYDNNDPENPYYIPTETTGCGNYSEPGFGHVWRLPTSSQMQQVLKAQIEGDYDFGILEGEKFHTAYDGGLTVSRIVWIEGGAIMTSDLTNNKQKDAKVRCIQQNTRSGTVP